MAKANIHDRGSIERVYPTEAFARDAAENDRPDIGLLHGVRIGSVPDQAGDFDLEPASRGTGEVSGAVFLAPFHREAPDGRVSAGSDSRHSYDAFVAEIIDVAQRFGYAAAASPGPGDRRIRGARQ